MNMAQTKTASPRQKSRRPPILEWATACLGLVVVAAAIGLTLFQALNGSDSPPDLSLKAGEARQTPSGWVVDVKAVNQGDETAAGVHIEGRLGAETANAELDYVPAHGEAKATMRLDADPRTALKLSVLGWREP
jgi:uncharacterized protein (TIGR02588 family)